MINITNSEVHLFLFRSIILTLQILKGIQQKTEMGNQCYNSEQNGLQNIEPVQVPQQNFALPDFFSRKNRSNPTQLNPQKIRKQENTKMQQKQIRKDKINLNAKNADWKGLIKQQYQKMNLSYKQHHIDQAIQHAQSLQDLLDQAKNCNLNYTLTQQEKNLLEIVKKQYKDVIFYETQIQRGGWDLKSDKNGMKISCRRQPDGTVGCRIQALCDVPFEILISIMIQVDFYKDYTPFIEVSRHEKQVARNCRIGYTQNHMPLFTRRESFFQGIGYSRLNHPNKEIFLFTRSIHDKPDLQELLEFPISINPDYIQLDYKYFVVRYRPIKKDLGIVDIGMNVDAKINLVPTWLMQKVSKDFGQKFFKNIVRISKNFKGSKWQKNVEKNPYLFLYFQKQLKQFLEKHNLN